MGTLAPAPVERDAVQDGVGDDQQAGGLQLLAQVPDVEHQNALVEVHSAFVTEHVQRTGGEQLQRQGDLLGLRLRLFQQLLPEGTERGDLLRPGGIHIHSGGASVDDRLVLGADTVLVDLFHQGHDELRLLHQGIVLAVALDQIQSVQPVLAASGDVEHAAYIRGNALDERLVLVFRVAYEDLVVRIEDELKDHLLDEEGLAAAGDAQHKARLIHQVLPVTENEVVGDGVLAQIDAARFVDLLDLERHEHGEALRGECAEGVYLPGADGQHGVEAVYLLEGQSRQLAHILACDGFYRLGIAVQLLLAASGQHHGQDAVHHPLVTGGQIVQELFGLLPLQLPLRFS